MKKELIYKLLWSTIEDFVGLWELQWELNSILKSDSSSNKELAKKVILFLFEAGLIKLYFGKWGGDQLQEISQKEVIKTLKKEKYWYPPEINEICIKVGSTEKGEKYYDEDLIGDVDLS